MSSQQTGTSDDGSQLDSTSLTADAIRRVGRDIKDILKEPHENIVYVHSTTKVNVGYAMVVGTCDTPYFCVPMFYRIEFPENYPHAPPKMKFLTQSSPNGSYVRMHPNYYVNGKCCLSILNSWSGEKWTGCQTLMSLLMTVLMTLTEDPLTNEPGYSSHGDTHDVYRAAVTEAGVHWINRFIAGDSRNKIRFCEDDTENDSLNENFKIEFIQNFVKNEEYGSKLLRMLKEYDDDECDGNMYSKFVKEHNMGSHYVSCYRSEYQVNFERVRVCAIGVLTRAITPTEVSSKSTEVIKTRTTAKAKPKPKAKASPTTSAPAQAVSSAK